MLGRKVIADKKALFFSLSAHVPANILIDRFNKSST
jgi:hypothetical protein